MIRWVLRWNSRSALEYGTILISIIALADWQIEISTTPGHFVQVAGTEVLRNVFEGLKKSDGLPDRSLAECGQVYAPLNGTADSTATYVQRVGSQHYPLAWQCVRPRGRAARVRTRRNWRSFLFTIQQV